MQGPFLRKYGAATTVNFQLFDTDGVDLNVTASHVAGDTKISKDEGAEVNTGSGFVDRGQGYSIALSATEMQASRVVVYVVDQGTKGWLDTVIVIDTYGHASAQHAFDLDTASTAQTGDSYAIVNNGTYGNSAIETLVDDLETRCTEARLSELDAATGGKMANQVDEIRTDTEDLQTQIGVDGAGLTNLPDATLAASQPNYAPNTVVPDVAGTAPTAAEIQAELEENGASVLDTIRDEVQHGTYGLSAIKTLIDAVPTAVEIQAEMEENGLSVLDTIRDAIVNATYGLAALETLVDDLETRCTEARLSELDAATGGKMANQVDEIRTDTEDIQTQVGTAGAGLTGLPAVTLANGAHGGAAAAITLADYSDFTGAGASNPNMLLSAEIGAVNSQTEFTLDTGSTVNDTYNDQAIVLYDNDNSDYPSIRVITAYVGATKTVTIDSAPDFTLDAADSVKIFVTAPGTSAPTAATVAGAVWDKAKASHTDAGSFGEEVQAHALSSEIPSAADIQAEMEENGASILDTIRDDLADGGRLDLILDELATQGDTNETKLDVIAAYIDTEIGDIQGRLPAALVNGRMSSDAVAISGSTDAADKLEASAETIETGAAAAGTLSTTAMTTDLTEVTDYHYNGRIIIWTSGVLIKQATNITDYDGTSKMLTFTAVTEAPGDGDTFIIV